MRKKFDSAWLRCLNSPSIFLERVENGGLLDLVTAIEEIRQAHRTQTTSANVQVHVDLNLTPTLQPDCIVLLISTAQ